MFGGISNKAAMMSKIRNGKLPIDEIEDWLQEHADGEEDAQDLSFIAETLNESLKEWERIFDECGIEYEQPARFTMEEIRKVYRQKKWTEATHIIAQEYDRQRSKLTEALREHAGR